MVTVSWERLHQQSAALAQASPDHQISGLLEWENTPETPASQVSPVEEAYCVLQERLSTVTNAHSGLQYKVTVAPTGRPLLDPKSRAPSILYNTGAASGPSVA